MKKLPVAGIIFLLVLPLLLTGCKQQAAKSINITTDEFGQQNNIVRSVELTQPGSLNVTLGANPTTGYQWDEANIDDKTVIEQKSRNYVAPTATGVVGAPGKDVWVFNSLKAGTTTIHFGYSRPWEGGEKDSWTLVLNVTVK